MFKESLSKAAEIVEGLFSIPGVAGLYLEDKINKRISRKREEALDKLYAEFRAETTNKEVEERAKKMLAHPEIDRCYRKIISEIEPIYDLIPNLNGLASYWHMGATNMPLLVIMLKRGFLPSDNEETGLKHVDYKEINGLHYVTKTYPYCATLDRGSRERFMWWVNTMLQQYDRCGRYEMDEFGTMHLVRAQAEE